MISNLDPIAAQIGLLIGLLQTATPANSYTLNFDWFADPITPLKRIPSDTNDLLTLLRDILGAASTNPPDERDWYPIQPTGALSNLYVVLPKDNGSSAVIGLGMTHTYTDTAGEIVITPKLYFPLFALPVTGDPFVLGQANTPIEVVLNIKDTKEKFTSQDQQGKPISFDGFELDGKICFAGTGSSFNLNFLDLQPSNSQSTYSTLADLLNSASSAIAWINLVLGRPSVTTWLNQPLGTSTETPGSLLVALGLLQLSASQYSASQYSASQYEVGDLSQFNAQPPLQILEHFFFTVLKQLASNTNPLIPIENGGVYVVSETAAAGTDYGLRLQIPDIAVPLSSNSSNNPDSAANSPQLKLQFGKWLTGEATSSDSWLKRSNPTLTTIPNPGVSVYLVQADSQNNPSFQPRVELVSLGLDYQGSNQTPLIDVQGVTLAGLEPRCYISIAPNTPTAWGVALRCDQLGLPLGKGLNSTASSNPIAQNLLDSGSDDQEETLKGDSASKNGDPQPVNPAFSAAIAYSTTVNFQLYDSDGSATDTVWIPMQRAFGPLHCQKIGVGWQDAARLLSFLFYGGVSLSVLDVELEGLSVGIPLNTPGQLNSYRFDLSGLEIDLQAGPVEISGGLLETKAAQTNVEYDGQALIKAGNFSISALGSYTTRNGSPSMFIFAFLNEPLGGPPAFFVTGLCAGFGYNRSLNLPAVDQIQSFPLVAALSDASQIGGANATPAQALTALNSFVPPTQGEDWIAAGVQFTSFELIHSHAVAVVEFGKELEIAVLGLSSVKLPNQGTETFAYVELELEIVLKPDAGLFSAMALLTANSYVLDPACHLTGGFAFYVWFGNNPHAGDFVLTVGGYHPQFTPPPWYPTVPRLGFNWAISDKLTIKGEAYFALTPSCVMGGGGLQLLYQDGGLRAWLKAYADFLMSWKPFSYRIDAGVSIGASYTFDLFGASCTISVELGASLALWGPPTAGSVTIGLWIITVTVSFGAAYSGASYVGWSDFATLLPQSPQPVTASAPALRDQSNLPVCKIQINQGLLKQTADGHWLVRSDEFTFTVESAVPITQLQFNGQTIASSSQPIGIQPMGLSEISSNATIQVTAADGTSPVAATLVYAASQRDLPEALWGQPIPSGQTPAPAANLLPKQVVGVNNVSLTALNPTANLIEIDVANGLGYDCLDSGQNYLPLSAETKINNPPQSSNQAISIISSTVNSPAVKAKRTSVFEILASLGINAGADGDLTNLATNVGSTYEADPMLGTPAGNPSPAIAMAHR